MPYFDKKVKYWKLFLSQVIVWLKPSWSTSYSKQFFSGHTLKSSPIYGHCGTSSIWSSGCSTRAGDGHALRPAHPLVKKKTVLYIEKRLFLFITVLILISNLCALIRCIVPNCSTICIILNIVYELFNVFYWTFEAKYQIL